MPTRLAAAASMIFAFALAGNLKPWAAQDETPPPDGTAATTQTDSLQHAVHTAHAAFSAVEAGDVASYVPALENVDPDLFGVAIATVDGHVAVAGAADHRFAIMSAAKPFTLALLLEEHGADFVIDKIGVEATGLPFDSAGAIELHQERSANPVVNANALAAVSVLPGDDPGDRGGRGS